MPLSVPAVKSEITAVFGGVGGLTGDGDGVTTLGDLAGYQSEAAEALLDRWHGAVEVIGTISRLTSPEGPGDLELSGGSLAGGAAVSLDDPATVVAQVKARLADLGLPSEVAGFFDDRDLGGPPVPGGAEDGALTFNLLENPADILKILLTDQAGDLVSDDLPAVGFGVKAGGFFPSSGRSASICGAMWRARSISPSATTPRG